MKLRRKIVSILLALALAVPMISPALAASAGETQRVLVTFAENADSEALLSQLAALDDVTVLHRYDLLLSGAAVEADAAALDAIRVLPGISDLLPTQTYSRPQAISDPLLTGNSLDLMAGKSLEYSGDGMVIAVLDSGLRCTHEAFAENDLTCSPAISREDVDAFQEDGGTPGMYLSERIPFAFDYHDGDNLVYTSDTHGTHVSALAVGYAKAEDGGVKFRGVAPAAQLLSMKVFGDSANTGANDADILKALEDAAALGADVICLSLGIDNGFVEDTALDGLYCKIFSQLREKGIIVCCAAGNAGSALSAKTEGIALPTSDYTDYGTIASPASYKGNVAVAAAQSITWQNAGYIQAGQRQIPFTRAVSETGADLPALVSLADQSLPVVPVGGTGKPEDFAAVDVAGKIALVQRGTIPFTEKVQNAAAAGAAACLIYNNDAENISPIVEDDTIPCALISLEDGAWLLESGTDTLTISGGAYVERSESAPAMLPGSAWGTTSDLRITPAITAPGGIILSASAEGDALYEQLSGTSMAAPNAAGAFALALEKLYQQGIDDKAQAADMAESLLYSTAQLMTDTDGTPLSPRRQGAGLIDLSSALHTQILIDDPLLELGESPSGSFRLSFRVKNLSDQPVELAVEPTALTDAWTTENGQVYSLTMPMDITERVTFTGSRTVYLPAGGEQAVTIQLTLSSDLRGELDKVFPNGFFIEGYITLTDGADQTVHTTFLGYRGDWEKAPVIEQTDFRDALDAKQKGEDLPAVNMGVNLVHVTNQSLVTDGAPLLGENLHLTTPWNEGRFAIGTAESDALYAAGVLFTTDLYTLRNAQRLIMVISDAQSGQIHFVADIPELPRSGPDSLTGEIASFCHLRWSGTDLSSKTLPDGSRVQVEFFAWTESDKAMTAAYERSSCDPAAPASYRWLTSGAFDRCLEWSFPVTIDRTSPTVSAETDEESRIEITVRDLQFLAHVTVRDGAGSTLMEEAFADDWAGTAHTLTVETGNDTVLYVTAVDYAGNTTAYAVDTAELAVEKCAMTLLQDVDMDAWYHRAVDYVWEKGLMAENASLSFDPSGNVTRADMVTLLYQLAGSPEEAPQKLPFTDVRSGADYRAALQWAYGKGLVSGYNETTFAAYASLPRQQLAAMLYRYAQLAGTQTAPDLSVLDGFSDREQVADWAAQAVAWAVEEGLLSGNDSGALAPHRSASRAELAQIIMNYLEK